MSEFNIILNNFSDLTLGKEFSVEGFITFAGPYYHDYNQDITDIYNKWQNGQSIDYWKLDSQQKEKYISCCAGWSGLLNELHKDDYNIDCGLITEDIDFYYLLGLSFAGERGYFGDYSYTLEDCLIEVTKRNRIMPSLIIINSEKLARVIGREKYTNLISIFKDYGFTVNEE